VSDATRAAAGTPGHLDFGDRQLHWLKNVPEPVAARSAAKREWATLRRSLRELSQPMRRRPHAGFPMTNSQVAG